MLHPKAEMPAPLRMNARPTTHDEDAVIAKVLQFVCLDPVADPVIEELEHLSTGVLASMGNDVGWRRSPECDVRRHERGRSPEVPVRPFGEDGPQQLDLLLRHRLRNLSRLGPDS
jgi:hypothetical protein